MGADDTDLIAAVAMDDDSTSPAQLGMNTTEPGTTSPLTHAHAISGPAMAETLRLGSRNSRVRARSSGRPVRDTEISPPPDFPESRRRAAQFTIPYTPPADDSDCD